MTIGAELYCETCGMRHDYCRCPKAPPSTQAPQGAILPTAQANPTGTPKCEKASAEKESGANTKQVGGDHYRGAPVQHWDFVHMHKMPYMEAQIFKYVLRWRDKGGLQDLEKAIHFIEKLIEQNTP